MSRFSALEVLDTGLVPAEEASHQQLMGLVVDKLYTQSTHQAHATAPLFNCTPFLLPEADQGPQTQP
jgi:hypothetical protein